MMMRKEKSSVKNDHLRSHEHPPQLQRDQCEVSPVLSHHNFK